MALFLLGCSILHGQATPAPDAGGTPKILYGDIPPSAPDGPVIVFIPGLRGRGVDWFINSNDMYTRAYNAGYRTAFIDMNGDGTANDAPVEANAQILAELLPQVATRFGVPKFYLVAHSKGGVDAQAAITGYPGIADLVEAVIMLATPNGGTELADWVFGPDSYPIGLKTPGVEALQTSKMQAFRTTADAISLTQGIWYYTISADTAGGNVLTAITGPILKSLVPINLNDGIVPSSRTRLPILYSSEVGYVHTNHFQSNLGFLSFPKINAIIRGTKIDEAPHFVRVDPGSGFGDRQNSFAWAMEWYKGKLYVGTGRAFICVTNATADATTGSNLYVPFGDDLVCTLRPEVLPLRAEIWQYSPDTKVWRRVYQSPQDVPVTFGPNGLFPIEFTAQDIAFRGMAIHQETDGTEALYVAGVGAAGMFGNKAPYGTSRQFPSPRILRSVDGENWTAVPHEPGTFLGNIGTMPSGQTIKSYGYRSLASFNGKLYATVTDFTGVGYVIASSNPNAGNNAWERVSPIADELPVWTLKPFNGFLYAATGANALDIGYGVYKTDGLGPAPYTWTEVVPPGAFQIPGLRSEAGLSLSIFNNQLYVGTDRPAELTRVNPDDTWELVVGAPRFAPGTGMGLMKPKSNYTVGLGNLFNGHFWSQAAHNGKLFVGTWDWTITLRRSAVGTYVEDEFGFDLFSTTDGLEWEVETKRGFNDGFNYGARNMVSTPYGLFVGTANPYYGLQVWADQRSIEATGDGVVDRADVAILRSAVGQTVPKGDLRDFDGDRRITENDVRLMMTQCTNPGCATSAARPLGPQAPKRVRSAASNDGTVISWDPVPGAVRYHIYQIGETPLRSLLPPTAQLSLAGARRPVSVQDLSNGYLDSQCRFATPTDTTCVVAEAIKSNGLMPSRVNLAGSSSSTTYKQPYPTWPAVYFVRAEDASGHISRASAIVPSMKP